MTTKGKGKTTSEFNEFVKTYKKTWKTRTGKDPMQNFSNMVEFMGAVQRAWSSRRTGGGGGEGDGGDVKVVEEKERGGIVNNLMSFLPGSSSADDGGEKKAVDPPVAEDKGSDLEEPQPIPESEGQNANAPPPPTTSSLEDRVAVLESLMLEICTSIKNSLLSSPDA